MWYSIVIFTAFGLPVLVQLYDKRGPYPVVQQCYIRGSEMIKDIVSSGKFPPIIHTQALCINAKNIKDEPKKPKKVEKGHGV